jgi:tetratricopeptide (TPR) repeat protein
MNDSNCIEGTRGEVIKLGLNPQGVAIGIVPNGPTADPKILDIFTCGIRFTTLARTLASLRAGKKCHVGNVVISNSSGRLEFKFPHKHAESKFYKCELDEHNSGLVIDFCESALLGESTEYGIMIEPKLRSIRTPRRNDQCPCGSGKKFKKCCLFRNTGNSANPPKLPDVLESALNTGNENFQGFIDYFSDNPIIEFDPEFWHAFAILANNEGCSQLAVDSMQKSIQLEPNNHGAQADLAAILGSMGQLEQALAIVNCVPDSRCRKWIIQANILQDLSRHDEAIECYEKAIVEEPDFFLPYARILNSLKAIGSPLYEYWLLRGCDSVPTSAWLGSLFCRFMLKEGRLHQLADADWLEMLKSEAGRPDMQGLSSEDPRLIVESQLFRLVARIHVEKNQSLLEEALELLKSVPIIAEVCDAAKLLATAAAYFGDEDIVEESFKSICSTCQSNSLGLVGPLPTYLATACHAKSDFERAVDYARQALTIDKNNITSLWLLWWGLDELGQTKDALLAAEELLQLKPNYPDLLYNLGFLSGKDGRFGRASYYYDRCLESSPRHWMAAENLTFVQLAHRNVEKADTSWNTFLEVRHSLHRDEAFDLLDHENQEVLELDVESEDDEYLKDLHSQILAEDELLVNAKQQKYDVLRNFAVSKSASEAYVLDLETLNLASKPILGAHTTIAKLRLDTRALLDAMNNHGGPNQADARFYLEMQYRRDLSTTIASVVDELPNWQLLKDAAKSSLLEAENRFLDPNTIDHAPTIGAYAKTLEITLSLKLFEQFRDVKGIVFQNTNSIQAMVYDKSNKAHRLASFVVGGHALELGSMCFILSISSGRTAQENALLGAFRDFVKIELGLSEILDSLNLDRLSTLVTKFRNPATHQRAFAKSETVEARDLSYDLLRKLLQHDRDTSL